MPDKWYRSHVLASDDASTLAYDGARGRVVMFGPASGVVWEWDGTEWLAHASATAPPVRHWPAMAYDAHRRRTVLFGGLAHGPLADTWEWDGSTWTRMDPVASPPARSEGAMAFDPVRGRCLLHGGYGGLSIVPLADTWEWDGSTWQRLQTGAGPGARAAHAMATDSARERIVLYGGWDGTTARGDTWEWDGVGWTERHPSSSPGPRVRHALAYDSQRARMVLVSVSGSTAVDAETWEWDGTTWWPRPTSIRPRACAPHAMAYDAARHRVVLHGPDSSRFASTWTFDGTDWRESVPAQPVRYPKIDYDSARERIVGAAPDAAGSGYLRLWEWSGVRWSSRLSIPAPSASNYFDVVYDAARQRLVVVSVALGPTSLFETWEWDGTSWTLAQPPTSPAPRMAFGFTYDPARQRVVLHGGGIYAPRSLITFGDTWEWDGSNWAMRGGMPYGLAGCVLAFDPVLQRVLRFGGSIDRFSWTRETATWDGTTWTTLQPSNMPAVSSYVACTDGMRRRVVLAAPPEPQFSAPGGTWEWDGSDWSLVNSITPAPALFSMALDRARGRLVGVGLPHVTWLHGTMVNSYAQATGPGCSGTHGPPALAGTLPRLGSSCRLDLHGARALAPCAIGLSAGSVAWQVGPCRFGLANPIDLVLAVTNASGFTARKLFIPPLSFLRGRALYAQAVVLDPQGAAGGLAMSPARWLSIGD